MCCIFCSASLGLAQSICTDLSSDTKYTVYFLAQQINYQAKIVESVIAARLDSNERLRSFLGPDYTFTPIRQAIEELVNWYEKRLKTLNSASLDKN